MKKHRKWTDDLVKELRRLAKQRTPTGMIAKKMKRTPGAIRQKAYELNVSLDTRS